MEAGLLWCVAGVFAVRAACGGPVGAAWGIAVIGAGLRWGTTGLRDVEVATRIVGPTVLTGPVVVRAAMMLALAGAVAGEAQVGGLSSRTWAPRGAALAALAVLPPVFVVGGPAQALDLDTLWWGLAAAVLTGAVLVLARVARGIPSWAPVAAATAGVAVAVIWS